MMLLLGIAAIAGGTTSTFFLYLFMGPWKDFHILLGMTVVTNLMYAGIVYSVFSRPAEESFVDRALTIAMYVVGFGVGIWLYFT